METTIQEAQHTKTKISELRMHETLFGTTIDQKIRNPTESRGRDNRGEVSQNQKINET